MTGKHERAAAAEAAALEGRIATEYGNRFEILERWRQGTKKTAIATPDDAEFFTSSEKVLLELEAVDRASLSAKAIQDLSDFRLLFNVAKARFDVVVQASGVQEQEDGGGKGVKPERLVVEGEEEGGYHDGFNLNEVVDDDTTEDSTKNMEINESDFEHNEDAMSWIRFVKSIEKKVAAAENAPASERLKRYDVARVAYDDFLNNYLDPETDAIEAEGDRLRDYPHLVLVLRRVGVIADRVEKYFNSEDYESDKVVPEYDREKPSEIFEHFRNKIADLHLEVTALENVPCDTADEAEAAVREMKRVRGLIREYNKGWYRDVKPIYDRIMERLGYKGLGPWRGLKKDHFDLLNRFYGEKGDDGTAVSEGVSQKQGRIFWDRLRAFRAERWESEFPDFEMRVAQDIILLQDARLRKGEARVKAMNAFARNFAETEATWESLRKCGPYIPREERQRGQRSVVNRYDVALRQLRRDIDSLQEHAPQALAARLDDVANNWRRALAMTDLFWNDGVNHRDRIAFLRRYGSGEATEEEMSEVIREEEKQAFEVVAASDVFDRIRARGAEEMQDRREVERRERAQMYHPELELRRMDAKTMYRRALYGNFWKRETSREERMRLLPPNAAVENDELQQYVVPGVAGADGYRLSYKLASDSRERVKEVEDAMYIRSEAPEGAVKPKRLRKVLERYLGAEQKEDEAWKTATSPEVWGDVPFVNRKRTLRYEFEQFCRKGESAFDEIPSTHRKPIVAWIFARLRLKTLGEYTQWLLDENPNLAARVKNIPGVFRVPEERVDDETLEEQDDAEQEQDDDGATVVRRKGRLSREDQRALTLPERVEPAQGEEGSGVFTEMGEIGPAADNADGGGGEEEEQAERAPEDGGEGRKEAVEMGAPEMIKATI